MQGLNDRLAAFLNRLRQMQANAGQMDTSAYHTAIKNLEDEIAKLKGMYEGELDRLRRALDQCNMEKNNLAAQAEKNAMMVNELQSKVQQLEALNQKLMNDLNALQGSMAGKDKMIADLQACLEAKERELERLRPMAGSASRELEEVKRRLEGEIAGRRDAEDKLKQLCAQREFDSKAKDDQLRDLQQRLDASAGIIASLEAKIRDLSNVPGMNLQALLQQLREGNASELRRLQKEMDEALNRQLGAMKGQLDENNRDKEELLRMKNQLQDEVARLRAMVADLQGQLNGCCQKNKELTDILNSERADSKRCIQELERRLKELQENLMAKMKECSNARDMQMSLKAEIDTYKNLLDAEESRLTKPSSNFTSSYQVSSNTVSGPGAISQTYRASGPGVGPGLTGGNTSTSTSKYMTTRGQPPAGSGTKDGYCAMHGFSGSGARTGPGLHSKGITEYNDRYCDSRSKMLHANPCGAPGFTTTKSRQSYSYSHH